MNINGKNDSSYRYTMEPLKSSICGKGNGIFTIIQNLETVSKYLNHPHILILKYMGISFGSIVNEEKQTITGSHTTESLQKCLQQYIDKFVICPLCGIPETIPKITKITKKNILLELQCSACSSTNNISNHKHSDIIVKYLEKNEWNHLQKNKGYMVNKSIDTIDIIDTINPFN
jgi:translation initiation factor 5